MSDEASRGVGFWVATVVGWSVIAFGIVGLWRGRGMGTAFDVATWVVAGNVVHDVVIVPVALLIGTALALVVRRPYRIPVCLGLAASALAVAVGYPALRGFGAKRSNPTLLPLDYRSAVLTVLVVIWGLVAVWCAVLFVGRARRGRLATRA